MELIGLVVEEAMRLFPLALLLASNAIAVPPAGDTLITNAQFSGTVVLSLPPPVGHIRMKMIPTQTNSASGSPAWVWSQSVADGSTNREVIYSQAFNYENGAVVNTNFHAWVEVWELNYQPYEGWPLPHEAIRQLEHYRVFIDRTTGIGYRYQGEVLADRDIEQNVYARRIWWAHPNKVNVPAVLITLADADSGAGDGKSSAEMEINGRLNVFGTTSIPGKIAITASALHNYAPFLQIQNAAATKNLLLMGSGEGFEQYGVGLDGQALIWAGQDILRIMAAKQILMSTNLAVFGDVAGSNIVTKGLTFNGTMTACPANPLTPTKWLPFTNNGARYYLPAYQ